MSKSPKLAPRGANLFAAASAIAPKPKSPKASLKPEVQVERLELYAAIAAATKSLVSMLETVGEQVKDTITAHFVEKGIQQGAQPLNFDGIDGRARASCQIKKRSSNSPLDATEVALLEKHGIPMETVTDVVETFIINPAHATNAELLERVSRALEKVPGLPADFIQKQVGTPKVIATTETLPAIFKLKREALEEVIRTAGVIAIRPQTEESISSSLGRVIEFLSIDIEKDGKKSH